MDSRTPPTYHFWPVQDHLFAGVTPQPVGRSEVRPGPGYPCGLSSGHGQFTTSANPAIDAPRRSRCA